MPDRDEMQAHGQPVARDNERFRLLASNGRPELPAGFSAPLPLKTTREVIAERLRDIASKKPAESC
jgi:hypothetical protein